MAFQLMVKKSVTYERNEPPKLLEYANLTRDEGTFNDFTIKVENLEISVHRIVLACCSNFFANMFKTNMKEKYQGFIEIQGFDGKIIKDLIEFIYTGKIVIDDENFLKTLSAADFLQLDDVKQFCFEFLGSCITADNCFAILAASKLYNGQALSEKIYRFIGDNLKSIAETDDFKSLERTDFIGCLNAINRNEVAETSLFHTIVAWTKADQDDEARKKCFPDLLRLIKLEMLSAEFLEHVVLVEDLVAGNLGCSKMVMSVLIQSLKLQKEQKNKSKLLSLGGSRTPTTATELYNLYGQPLNAWHDLPYDLDYFCAVKSSNYIYCIGGRNNTFSLQKVWRKDINKPKEAWVEIAQMKEKRQSMGADVYDDKIVVAGGFSGRNRAFFRGMFDTDKELSSAEYLSPSENEWKTIASLNQRRCGNALVASKGCLYALGGWCHSRYLSSVERLRDLNAAWEFVRPMQTPRRWFAAVDCNGEIYAIGGRSGDDISQRIKSVEKYNAQTNSWTYVQDMNFERSGAFACVLHGRIFVAGGLDSNDQFVLPMECYDPASNTWSIVKQNVQQRLLNHVLISV